jgi:hypothetical protein
MAATLVCAGERENIGRAATVMGHAARSDDLEKRLRQQELRRRRRGGHVLPDGNTRGERMRKETVFYRSSNGDQWFLIQESGTNALVRHQPNRASGGQSSVTTVDEFLLDGHGPQHEALLRLGIDYVSS